MNVSVHRIAIIGLASASVASAEVTVRVSLDSGGAQANNTSSNPAISSDGRYVSFLSVASNLVAGDTNGTRDAFVRDRQTGATERVSVDSGGAQASLQVEIYTPAISGDGRFVAFTSKAPNLVVADTNNAYDVFLRDRLLGTTERVSISSIGGEGNFESTDASVSADGRYVAFASYASTLVPLDANGLYDIFVRDRVAGTTERVSVATGGGEANDHCGMPSISADGRFVAFGSSASNLVAGDTNGVYDMFVHDRQTGVTERVSVDSAGVQANNLNSEPSLSGDGRYAVYYSNASNLVPGDTNGNYDVFLRDRQTNTTSRVSLGSGGAQASDDSFDPSISADGRFVAFGSYASNLVSGDTNAIIDVFVRDRQTGTTQRVNVSSSGAQCTSFSYVPAISGDGLYVAFQSLGNVLVQGDTNLSADIFVRERFGGPNFTSLCSPGVSGVIACPCGNPPSGLGRGCDNSSSTGGAILSASGGTYLSSDSLVFHASGEKPTALSIVAQWTGGSATGVVFGMGVRCTSGALKRLYTKTAVGGSIHAPNYGAGDLPVSARSAALGDAIAAGQSRWYLVYYRDATVLGGCPSVSTFNATQTGQVTWSP